MVFNIFFFFLGAIFGSFLNVCIVRLPKEESIVTPRSHCVQCKNMIPWYDNIPFFSYIFLGGKCRFCKAKISIRYFLVELLTALCFLGFYLYYGLTPVLFPYFVMLCCFIISTFVDLEHRIIPDEVSIGGMFLGILFSIGVPGLHEGSFANIVAGRWLFWAMIALGFLITIFGYLKLKLTRSNDPEEREDLKSMVCFLLVFLAAEFLANVLSVRIKAFQLNFMSLDSALIGALIGGGSLYFMGELGSLLFRKEAMGGGDVKLLALIGAFLGWETTILVFFIAPVFGAVYGIIEKVRTGDSYLPYGPFIVLASFISLFYGDRIIAWILTGHGLF